jgi:hypothetical protein
MITSQIRFFIREEWENDFSFPVLEQDHQNSYQEPSWARQGPVRSLSLFKKIK